MKGFLLTHALLSVVIAAALAPAFAQAAEPRCPQDTARFYRNVPAVEKRLISNLRASITKALSHRGIKVRSIDLNLSRELQTDSFDHRIVYFSYVGSPRIVTTRGSVLTFKLGPEAGDIRTSSTSQEIFDREGNGQCSTYVYPYFVITVRNKASNHALFFLYLNGEPTRNDHSILVGEPDSYIGDAIPLDDEPMQTESEITPP